MTRKTKPPVITIRVTEQIRDLLDEEAERLTRANVGGRFSRDSVARGILLDALAKLRFGAIQLTVHEGKLVQVDVTERKRFVN